MSTSLTISLQLALDYLEFFESLMRMMERVGGHLSYLSKFALPIFRDSPDVQKVCKPSGKGLPWIKHFDEQC